MFSQLRIVARRALASTHRATFPAVAFSIPRTQSTRLLSISKVVCEEYENNFRRDSTRQSSPRRDTRVPSPPSERLYIGNLPWDITSDEIKNSLATLGFDSVGDVRIGVDRQTGQGKGYAHIELADIAKATEVYEAAQSDSLFIGGRPIRVDYAAPPRDVRPTPQPGKHLRVGDIRATRTEIQQAFENWKDRITDTRIFVKVNENGDEYAHGFLDFVDNESAAQALAELNGQEITPGAKLLIDFANPPPPRRERSDFGSRRSGGDRGDRRPMRREQRQERRQDW
ncbi:hypothetical protein SISNIDRAFT_471764 [Sistotremastrum niveocremeum HHB9708]|uniref:RRM domain-containing protein n=1 Tax=Sistotremastrum niveocremeum HHB9708 TaxID=1314777 RepID=A0A164M8K6_9AGAM|nr:hypothetical protein SISNIDRAFT_471764 [Sistotremastrum niveocremeum HHB9708]